MNNIKKSFFIFVLSLCFFVYAENCNANCNCICGSDDPVPISDISACVQYCNSATLAFTSCESISDVFNTADVDISIESKSEAEVTGKPNTTPAPAPRKAITLQDPLKLNAGGNEVQVLIGRVIQTILGLVGSIALLMFVYGGFLWMIAAGNEERVKKGKEILIWASLGLAIIFASYILVFFLLKTLLGLSG